MKKTHKVLVKEPEYTRLFWRQRSKREHKHNVDLIEIMCVGSKRIQQGQYRVRWQSLVVMELNVNTTK